MITRRSFLKGLTASTALVAVGGAVATVQATGLAQTLRVHSDKIATYATQSNALLATLQVNGGKPRLILRNGIPLEAGDIRAGEIVSVAWPAEGWGG